MAGDVPNREQWEKMLYGIDFSTLKEDVPIPKEADVKRVFVQKIVTEVYVYTDLNNKVYGSGSVQDITVLGEMDYDAALKIIADRKARKKK